MSIHIRAQGITLDVPLYQQPMRQAGGWGALLLGAAFDPPRRRLVRLLEDVAFELGEGDRLAILGRNGAGKSTLLRVLNRVYQPTRGTLRVKGTCQALLNMGLGFNGEATVMENIYLRGVAMGLKAPFLRTQVDSILDFSGLTDKSGHRLRTLSSGQRMRLGFAISTSVQHDIILMDEWVGAGDAEFMAKAKERMQRRVGGSKIVVLASHSTGLLRDICNKGIVLEKGRCLHFGDIGSSLKCYHDLLARLREEEEATIAAGKQTQAEAASRALVYGCIEDLSVNEPGLVVLKGWFVDTEGVVPGGLALQMGGLRYAAEHLQLHARPDVKRHLGLSTDECGFKAIVRVDGVNSAADLGRDLQVFGGRTTDVAGAPLRLASKVLEQVAPDRSGDDR